jgi:hypothetical protein
MLCPRALPNSDHCLFACSRRGLLLAIWTNERTLCDQVSAPTVAGRGQACRVHRGGRMAMLVSMRRSLPEQAGRRLPARFTDNRAQALE